MPVTTRPPGGGPQPVVHRGQAGSQRRAGKAGRRGATGQGAGRQGPSARPHPRAVARPLACSRRNARAGADNPPRVPADDRARHPPRAGRGRAREPHRVRPRRVLRVRPQAGLGAVVRPALPRRDLCGTSSSGAVGVDRAEPGPPRRVGAECRTARLQRPLTGGAPRPHRVGSSAGQETLATAVALAALAGCRRGELCALRWDA